MMKTLFSRRVMLTFSLFFLIRGNSPIFLWRILELNLMFVLFFIFENINSVKVIVCYFVFQIYGRLLFFYGFIRHDLLFLSFVGLAAKFGLFPFHVWQPYVFNTSRWKTCLLIAGPQKAFLLLLFTFLNIKINNSMLWLIITTVIVCNLYLIFLYDLKKTFAYLSIRRATWLLLLIRWSLEQRLWFLYLYNTQLIMIFVLFLIYEIFSIERKKHINIMILIFIFSYSGIPPLIGFFIKVQILDFFFYFYYSILYLLIFTIIIIPSTFYLSYYRIVFFLKKKLVLIHHTSLFFIIALSVFFFIPSFYIFL